MRTLLLLMLVAMLPCGLVSAAPARIVPHVPGDLAKDRLQDFTDLLGASDQVLLVQPDQSRAVLPEAQAKVVMSLVRDLVLDDALYSQDVPYGWGRVTETITLTKGGMPGLTLCVDQYQPTLRLYRFNGGRTITADYSPVLSKVKRLLQTLNPNDHSLGTFHPLEPPVPIAKGIPTSALARIATIKPGMTRADVLRLFAIEGGLSTTYWNHYVYRDYGPSCIGSRDSFVTVSGELIKVNINFAPSDADIVWLNGRGFWLHQSSHRSRPGKASLDGQTDDIILGVSPPYLEYFIAD